MSRSTGSHNTHKERKTLGWIDSMSVTQVVQAFEVWPDESQPFGWDIPATVTALLLWADNIALSPGLPGGTIQSGGPIGVVTRGLIKSGVLESPTFSAPVRKEALKQTRRRVFSCTANLRDRYQRFLQRYSKDIEGWMDWGIRSAWVEHTQNFGSLVDAEFVPQLAMILDTPLNDLRDLQRLTSSPDVVTDFVRRQPDNDDFRMAYQCFLLGALLRGLYHDYLVRSAQQVVHHPFREVLLPRTGSTSLLYEETTTESYLTNIVLHSALSGTNTESRLSRWVDNIGRIRKANRPGYREINLRHKDDPSCAKKEAVRAAREMGIDVRPEWFETVIDLAHAVGVGALGAYLLEPYGGKEWALALGGVDYLAFRHVGLGKQVARAVFDHPWRLSRLAESPPGRISRLRIDVQP